MHKTRMHETVRLYVKLEASDASGNTTHPEIEPVSKG
jgi:hypothetical protein